MKKKTFKSVSKSRKDTSITPKIEKGQGKISTSGMVIMGHDSDFKSCLHAGDAILVCTPIGSNTQHRKNISLTDNGTEKIKHEMRIITMVISSTSAAISSSFSCDIQYPSEYSYIVNPCNKDHAKNMKQNEEIKRRRDLKRFAFGTYETGEKSNEYIYRERTEHGGYRIRRDFIKHSKLVLSRSAMLDMRSKRKSDRYC